MIILAIFSGILITQFVSEFFLSPGYFKGTHNDFLAFYTTGQLSASGHIDQVYDEQSLTDLQRQIVPHPVGALGYMPYLNPPFVAVLLAPLEWVDVNDARLIWMIINVLVMIGVGWVLTRSVRNRWLRVLFVGLIASSYPVFQNLIQGQLSIIITALSLLGIYFAEKQRWFTSGLCLSILAVKPQLALFVGIALLIFRQWDIIKGILAGVGAVVLITLPFTGIKLYQTYASFSAHVGESHVSGAGRVGDTTWKGDMKYMYSLSGLSVATFGQNNVVLTNTFTYGIAAILIALFAWASRVQRPSLASTRGRLVLAATIAIALVINPHAYSHDGILLLAILAVILPIWKDAARTTLYFLVALVLMYIDQQTGSHWTTVSLILCVIAVLSLIIQRKASRLLPSHH